MQAVDYSCFWSWAGNHISWGTRLFDAALGHITRCTSCPPTCAAPAVESHVTGPSHFDPQWSGAHVSAVPRPCGAEDRAPCMDAASHGGPHGPHGPHAMTLRSRPTSMAGGRQIPPSCGPCDAPCGGGKHDSLPGWGGRPMWGPRFPGHVTVTWVNLSWPALPQVGWPTMGHAAWVSAGSRVVGWGRERGSARESACEAAAGRRLPGKSLQGWDRQWSLKGVDAAKALSWVQNQQAAFCPQLRVGRVWAWKSQACGLA
jgi:hypothetical protein